MVPAFYHPAYWGALLALLVGICMTVYGHAVVNEVHEQAGAIPEQLAIAVTVLAVLVAVVVAVRYYVAVSLNIYSGVDKNLFDLPYPLNMGMFLILSIIIFLCSTTVAVFSVGGPMWVVTLGPFISIVSLVALAIMSIAFLFRPSKFVRPPPRFVLTEVALFFLTVIVNVFSVFGVEGVSFEERAAISGSCGAAVLVVFLYDCWSSFREPLLLQLGKLRSAF